VVSSSGQKGEKKNPFHRCSVPTPTIKRGAKEA